MAARSRDPSRSWVVWLIGGLVVALVVVGAYVFATRTQQADLPRAPVGVDLPSAPALPETPNLPPAPIPAPR